MVLHVGHVDARLDLTPEPAGTVEAPPPAPDGRWATKEALRPLVVEIVDEELERYRRSRA
jgi:hypothetical protein